MDTHRYAVREIAKEVRGFYEQKRPFRLYHGSTYSTRAMHDPHAIVNTSDLNHILDINTASKFVIVEPNVPMDQLLKETLKHRLMPPVVPAFPGTTVGGTFAGTAAGSSSFKHGFFDHAVTWMEIVLANGTITTASRQRHPELLAGIVGTLGTIGITTLFQVQLVPATSNVDLRYIPVISMTEALDTMDACIKENHIDFVEGLIYGEKAPSYGVIAVGKMTANREHSATSFSSPGAPWFYERALQIGNITESIPIFEYVFRYDRGSFCMGRHCFGRIPLNNLTRRLTNSATHSQNMEQTIQSMHWADHFFIQDLVIPQESTPDMLRYLDESFGIYPLRLCPIRQWPETHASIGMRGYTEDTILNAAKFKEKNRDLERVVQELGGMKWLYSRNYYTENEFWDIYPQLEYKTLRTKYDAQYLPSVYEKVKYAEKRTRAPKPKGFWNWVFRRTSVLAMKHGSE
ncbi:FAD-binding domain-containing protein [Lophiostoma macrostomum CBS 122681]|uniref:Delta(24)-sterol reductase n=1 Tax=Lophiostoma macrostomum CBS 122681 TaxID=1314788 RepID=A0A6A6SSX8_9PLEO|nr:FAD-binding domain-containing protein [Lophiostoma macrostomum CBS 122681]